MVYYGCIMNTVCSDYNNVLKFERSKFCQRELPAWTISYLNSFTMRKINTYLRFPFPLSATTLTALCLLVQITCSCHLSLDVPKLFFMLSMFNGF